MDKVKKIKECKHKKTMNRIKEYQKYGVDVTVLPINEEWLQFICLECGGIVREQKIIDLAQNG